MNMKKSDEVSFRTLHVMIRTLNLMYKVMQQDFNNVSY